MAQHNELGHLGENIAANYLQKKGYKIIAKNYRFRRNEIDLIAEFENKLIAVEVKTRQSTFMAGPEETVTKTKQRRIIECINAFIDENEIDLEIQFDIVSVLIAKNEQNIRHISDAFYPVI